jgi:hypothetical protein
MKRRFAVLLVTVSACAASDRANHQSNVIAPLEITVINASNTSEGLPGAEVTVLDNWGRERAIGYTDTWGRITLTAAQRSKAHNIVVCSPLFYCGVLRLQEFGLRQSQTLALAPIVLR